MSLKGQLEPCHLQMLWRALHAYRDRVIPGEDTELVTRKQARKNDAEWDDLCTVMAWLAEDYDIDPKDGYDHIDAPPFISKVERESVDSMVQSYFEDCISGPEFKAERTRVTKAINKLLASAGW